MPSNTPDTAHGDNAAPADSELLARWTTGDEAAFTALFQRHAGLIYSVALRQAASPQTAAEVVTQVMTAVARKAGALQKLDNLPGWLHRAAVLEMRRHRRAASRDARRLAPLEELNAMPTPPDSDLSAVRIELDRALLHLNGRDRRYIFERFYEGRQVREIAARSGESEAAVQKRGHRALERLAGLLSRRRAVVGVPALMAMLSQSLQLPAPAAILGHGAAASLKAAAGWQASKLAWTLPAVQLGTACALIAAAVWQETLIPDGPPAARSPARAAQARQGPLGNPAPLQSVSFRIPDDAFDPDNPNLPALAEFCYRYSIGAADRELSSRLFFQISDWFGPHRKGKGLELLEKLYALDIPTAHCRELAARMLEYDWIGIPEKLAWTLKFHAKTDPPGIWHEKFMRSIAMALSRWAKEDLGAAWQWMEAQIKAGSLSEASKHSDYLNTAMGQGLAAIYLAAAKEKSDLLEEIAGAMTTSELSATLGLYLRSLPVDSPDVIGCLDRIASLPSNRLRRVALSNVAGWLGDVTAVEAAGQVTRLAAAWNAPDAVKAELVPLLGPVEGLKRAAYLRGVLESSDAALATALAAKAGREGTAQELAALMPIAVARGCWREMVNAAKDKACVFPSSTVEAGRFAQLLPLVPDPRIRRELLEAWASAASAKGITRESLTKAGWKADLLNILLPHP